MRDEAVERLFPGVVEKAVEKWLGTYETHKVDVFGYATAIPSIARSVTHRVAMPFTFRVTDVAVALPEDAFFIPPGEHKISVAHGVEIAAKTDKYAMARLIVWRREFGETLKNRLILEKIV